MVSRVFSQDILVKTYVNKGQKIFVKNSQKLHLMCFKVHGLLFFVGGKKNFEFEYVWSKIIFSKY